MDQKKIQKPMTFEVQIDGCSHFTWQGVLKSEEAIIPFRSALELLLAMDKALCSREDPSCK